MCGSGWTKFARGRALSTWFVKDNLPRSAPSRRPIPDPQPPIPGAIQVGGKSSAGDLSAWRDSISSLVAMSFVKSPALSPRI